MEKQIKININEKLSESEENLISRNCCENMVLIINHSSDDKTSVVVKQNKFFPKTNFKISYTKTEEHSLANVKIDKQCDWWLEGKHSVILYLEDSSEYTDSFEVILVNDSNEELFFDVTLELLDFDKKNDIFHNWYLLQGSSIYYVESNKLLLGTFARVSDGWKFYPSFTEFNDEI